MNSDVTLVNEIESRVEASARLMDENRPGWFNEVDLDDFDIQNPEKCVLYQVYGGYIAGMRKLGATDWENPSGYLFFDHDDDHENLTNRAWGRAILYRRAQ